MSEYCIELNDAGMAATGQGDEEYSQVSKGRGADDKVVYTVVKAVFDNFDQFHRLPGQNGIDSRHPWCWSLPGLVGQANSHR